MSPRLRILAVCTHNRTRSILMQELIKQHAATVDVPVLVKSAGFRARGEAPTDTTIRLLKARGIQAKDQRSLTINESGVMGAGLIVTAEKAHVVSIVGRWPQVFANTFTLPEIVELGRSVGPRAGRSLAEWLEAINADRPAALDYLDTDVGTIADPTGGPPTGWMTCFTQIDELSSSLARLLV
jgi:protein-tyrosine-phosphatase